ncbi:hypothetical protein ARMGADRAFT_1037604 [Armillaria gallica]|uniref:Uncharacterized protein n=1 Tax=Armillaria gallica TaxID=47427 RepID=A0A2H3CL00_ARMGA|nr:hypothetical protein ARMGADRAFT_1037604 [Armillaria gallica]
MSLSHIRCDLDHLMNIVQHMQPDIQGSAKVTIKYLQTQETQLSQFDDFAVLGNGLVVDSLGSEHTHYLLWADGEEEVVLNIQGILAEVYIQPIASSKVQPLSKAYQSMKIVSLDNDKQFTGALQAIDNIRVFMSRHFTPMDKAIHSNTVGDMQAICAENRLSQGDHIYMEDNMVIFHEWTKDEADNMSGSLFRHISEFNFALRVATNTHPGTLRAGDLVNMGIFSKGHIQIKPVAVGEDQEHVRNG